MTSSLRPPSGNFITAVGVPCNRAKSSSSFRAADRDGLRVDRRIGDWSHDRRLVLPKCDCGHCDDRQQRSTRVQSVATLTFVAQIESNAALDGPQWALDAGSTSSSRTRSFSGSVFMEVGIAVLLR